MLKSHFFDPNNSFSSKLLKKYLNENQLFKNKICIDAPSGNGRNSFLLARYFKEVICYDINSKYLDEIINNKPKYSIKNVFIDKLDLLTDIPNTFTKTDFICISHFYDFKFLMKLSKVVKKGCIIYIETFSCKGQNYYDLPDEKELNLFLDDFKIISINKVFCNSNNRINKSISFTALLEKLNGTYHEEE